MGGVVGSLLYFYCRSGCQASVVASYLAFHPPEPSYEILEIGNNDTNDESNEKTTSNSKNDRSSPYVTESQNRQYAFVFRDDLTPNYQVGVPITDNPSTHLVTASSKIKIPVLYFSHPNASCTILFSHGNATDLGGMFNILCAMSIHLKVNMVGYDYTGYGSSSGPNIQTTEKQTYKDIESVYDWLITTHRVHNPKHDLILYGQSVGSGPSVYLASRKSCAGLILHSPILSGIRVLTPSRALWCFDIFPNIDRIRAVSCPVFVMHGKEDAEVGLQHGVGLHDAVRNDLQYEPWWVPQRGHNNLLSGNEREFFRRVGAFLRHVDSVACKDIHNSTSAVAVALRKSRSDRTSSESLRPISRSTNGSGNSNNGVSISSIHMSSRSAYTVAVAARDQDV